MQMQIQIQIQVQIQIQIQIQTRFQIKKKNIVKGTKDFDIKCLNICTNDDFGANCEVTYQKIPSEMEVVSPVTKVSNGLCAVQI